MLAAATAVALDRSGEFQWLEDRTSDWRSRFAVNPAAASKSIVIIDIDNASFRVLTDQLGRWPWTRRLWTELVSYLNGGRPKLLLFDVIFAGAEPAADPAFADAIRRSGNVVLPFAFVSGSIETDDDLFTPPHTAALKLASPNPSVPLSRSAWSINRPHASLAEASVATGSNLWTPDPDGITRRLPLSIRYEGDDWSALWLAAALQLHGGGEARYVDGRFQAGPIRLPVDAQGRFTLRWYGDTLTAYRSIPLWEMVCSIHPDLCEPGVPRHPPEEFRDKIVFVGASAAGSYEVRPTPVSESAPGVFILATALDNVLQGHAITPLPQWAGLLLIAIMAAVPAWPVFVARSIAAPLAVTVGLLLGYAGFCFVVWRSNAAWVPMAAPLLSGALSFSGTAAWRYLTVDRELSRTRGTLERYVSPQLVRHVMDHLDDFRFDGQKRRLTVFFSDVRGFTTLTEKSDPVELLKQLNEYLEAMTDIIFRYDGIVDKFIGDGIMAHWGAFTPDRPNARLAAQASLEMLAKLAELNQKWTAEGRQDLDIGIGLNTADVIFGNVGTGKKVDFTAIGDGVNLAARLEGANKEYRTHIIISESTYLELGEDAEVSSLGMIVVKGKTIGVPIYELLGMRDSSPA